MIFLSGCVENRPQTTTDAMVSWLSQNGHSPADYVVSSFKDHDIVFLGEYHRVKHDPMFVQSLIPELYDNGIYTLGMEFACAVDQDRIDRLIKAPRYNETLAIDILRNQYYYWAYREYADIFRAAWKLNSKLSENAPRFRIVGLNIYTDYVKENCGTPEERKKETKTHALGDRTMAETIKREILTKGGKALIYCGSHHAFTRYHQLWSAPRGWQPSGLDAELNAKEKEDYWYHIRTGNYILDEIGNRTMTIRLHGAWSSADHENYILPCKGTLDKVAIAYDKPVAFDIRGSPFEDLGDPDCDYALSYDNLTLFDLYDGYIILSPITEFEPVTVIPAEKWVDTPEVLRKIRLSENDPDITGEEFIEGCKRELMETFAFSYARPTYIARNGKEPVDIKTVFEGSDSLIFVLPPELRESTKDLIDYLKKEGKNVEIVYSDEDLVKTSGTLWVMGTPESNALLNKIDLPFEITDEGIALEGKMYEGKNLTITTILPNNGGWMIISTGRHDKDIPERLEMYRPFAYVLCDYVDVLAEGFYQEY
jgi:hypothetical protein